VEYQYPYEWQAEDLATRAREAGVRVVLHNMPRGDAALGEHGTACLPGREARFREDLERAIAYAKAVGCPRLNALAGIPGPGLAREEAKQTLIENLRYSAGKLKAAGLTLLTEPCNPRTIPGFLLNTSKGGIEVIDAAGADNLQLQYDVFHMQIVEGDLAKTIERLLARIGHIQIADVPDRNEPGTGEINFPWLLAKIDALGYAGWIGAEYIPKGDTAEGLKWATPYLK